MPKCSKINWNHKPHFDINSVVIKSTDHGNNAICLLQVNIIRYILTVFLCPFLVKIHINSN